MIIAVTGPRPYKIGCQVIPSPVYNNIYKGIHNILSEKKPDKFLSGFAMGVDLWAAQIAFKLNIPVKAVIPFPDQDKMYEEKYKKIYAKFLAKSESHIISESYYPAVYQDRNEYMVDECDLLIAVFHDSLIKSGTRNCIAYAKAQKKEIIIVNPFL